MIWRGWRAVSRCCVAYFFPSGFPRPAGSAIKSKMAPCKAVAVTAAAVPIIASLTVVVLYIVGWNAWMLITLANFVPPAILLYWKARNCYGIDVCAYLSIFSYGLFLGVPAVGVFYLILLVVSRITGTHMDDPARFIHDARFFFPPIEGVIGLRVEFIRKV